ncbi:hypothetical protein ABK040_000686 [Willaertia magna]
MFGNDDELPRLEEVVNDYNNNNTTSNNNDNNNQTNQLNKNQQQTNINLPTFNNKKEPFYTLCFVPNYGSLKHSYNTLKERDDANIILKRQSLKNKNTTLYDLVYPNNNNTTNTTSNDNTNTTLTPIASSSNAIVVPTTTPPTTTTATLPTLPPPPFGTSTPPVTTPPVTSATVVDSNNIAITSGVNQLGNSKLGDNIKEVIENAPIIPGLFIDGFYEYFKLQLFTDVTLQYKNISINGHKIILSYKSKYFYELFNTSKNDNIYKIEINDLKIDKLLNLENILYIVIEYLYTGKAKINADNIVSLKIASNYFRINSLSLEIENFLYSYINLENVFLVLEQSILANDLKIENICIDFISSNFDLLFKLFLEKIFIKKELPLNILFSVIGNENLKIKLTDDRCNKVNLILERLISEYHLMDDNIPVDNIDNSEAFKLDLLKKMIHASVKSETMLPKMAVKCLKYCDTHQLIEESKGCAKILASNFHTIYSNNLNVIFELSPLSFIELLRFDDLFIKNEDQVFEIAKEYISKNSNHLNEKEMIEIYKSIRYTYLSMNTLNYLKLNPIKYISINDIIEALWARVGRLEGKDNNNDNNDNHLKPRRNRVFTYEKDFDTNGILYWLGTSFGSETYINPIERKLVTLTSTANCEVGKLQDLISYEPCKCNLVSKVNTTITLCFETIMIMPTKYSLRHTLSRDGEALRNWILSGSNDNINYIDLLVHTNDNSITLKGQTASWDIDSNNIYFKYFRIIQNGNNSSNNNYFSLAGMEIYGLVRRLSNNDDNNVKELSAKEILLDGIDLFNDDDGNEQQRI